MNLEDIQEDLTGLSIFSGAVLRRMDCGCVTFPYPVDLNHYLVIKSCDSSFDEEEDVHIQTRQFQEHHVKNSTFVPAAPFWLAINRLMSDGITARRLRRQLNCLLKP